MVIPDVKLYTEDRDGVIGPRYTIMDSHCIV